MRAVFKHRGRHTHHSSKKKGEEEIQIEGSEKGEE